MARTRVVSLRPVRRNERRILKRKIRDKKLPVRIHQRYRIIAEASQRKKNHPTAVAERVGVHVTTVYQWIHRFNAMGLEGIEDPPNRGAAFLADLSSDSVAHQDRAVPPS
jgi:hypothetical protein